jgi:hypothetical protein
MRHFLLILVAGLLCLAMTSGMAFADGGGRIGGSGFGTPTIEYDDSDVDDDELEEDLGIERYINQIRLTYADGSQGRIMRIPVAVSGYTDLSVTIEVRAVQVTDPFFERIGVDFDFDYDDGVYDEANRVGNAYRIDQSTMFLALNSSVFRDPATPELDAASIKFLNQDSLSELDAPDFSQTLTQRDLNIALGELGRFGAVRTLTAPKVDLLDNSVVTGRLDQEDYRRTSKLPFLDEIPGLMNYFAGPVHQDEQRNLVVFIRPHVLEDHEREE